MTRRLPHLAWRFVFAAIVLAWPGAARGQFTQTPAPAAYVLKGVTVVHADGRREVGVTLLVRDGRLERLGPDVAVPADARVLEGDSLYVYPGLVDAQGDAKYELPKSETDRSQVASWDPPRDAQDFMPHRRLADYLTATGADLAGQRKKGIVAAAVLPSGPVMPGQGAVLLFRKSAETPWDLVVNPALGPVMTFDGARGVYPSTLFGVIAFYRQRFLDAAHLAAERSGYAKTPTRVEAPAWDPDLGVLNEIRGGGTPVFFEADLARDISRVLALAGEEGFRPVIVGGEEAWKRADALKAANVPVLVSLDFPKPERWKPEKKGKGETAEEPGADGTGSASAAQESEALDAAALKEKQHLEEIYSNAGKLEKAGVTFALTSGGGKADLLEGARKAIEYGLSEDAALRALTATPAAVLGLPALGRVESGGMATFVVTDGPLFGEKTKVVYTFVEGELEETPKKAAKAEEAPAVDVTGTWSVTIQSDQGSFDSTIEAKQTGANVSGTMRSQFGQSEIKDGLVSGNTLSFSIEFEAGGESFSLDFSGTVEGDAASGTGSGAQGSFTWTAKRSSGPGGQIR